VESLLATRPGGQFSAIDTGYTGNRHSRNKIFVAHPTRPSGLLRAARRSLDVQPGTVAAGPNALQQTPAPHGRDCGGRLQRRGSGGAGADTRGQAGLGGGVPSSFLGASALFGQERKHPYFAVRVAHAGSFHCLLSAHCSASPLHPGQRLPWRLLLPVWGGIGTDDPAPGADHARPERRHRNVIGPAISARHGLVVAVPA
jgi:hypothetical protein